MKTENWDKSEEGAFFGEKKSVVFHSGESC